MISRIESCINDVRKLISSAVFGKISGKIEKFPGFKTLG